MRVWPVLLFLVFGWTGGVHAAPPPAPEGYRWVRDDRFSDEFNGTSLDTNKWLDHFPGWRGRPPAKFVPSAITVTNGCLQINAGILPEPDGPFTISGGAVRSKSEEAFYGYYEARFKASRISMSSTFWLNGGRKQEAGANVSLEIDIVETVGAPHSEPKWARNWNRQMNSNTHYKRRINGRLEPLSLGNHAPLDPPAGEAFHTYGAWWVDANTIKFYLDDQYQFTVHPATNYSTTPFDRPMHVNMVCETYDWMAPPALTDLTNNTINTACYDWVRAHALRKRQATEKAAPSFAAEKPNILFIMSDDHTTQAIGAYGGRLATLNPTPTLDRLAHEGMMFTHAHCNNSICTPSRASILTGQYSQANGVLVLDQPLPPPEQHLPREMKKAGYQTAMIGKWHLTAEPATFDYYCVLPGQGKYFNPTFDVRGPNPWPKNTIQREGYVSDIITDLGIDWLAHRDPSKPFFLMLHHKAPHDMFEFAPRYSNYLANVEIPEPENLYDQPSAGFGSVATRGTNDSLIHRIGTSVSKRHPIRNYGMDFKVDANLHDREYTHRAYQEYLKRYLRCVKGVDDNLSRLFDYLKRKDLWDKTVIMYTSDQGMMLGEHDYIDKRWMYDESMRMPFIVRYPKLIQAGSTNDMLINNTDFAPTMLELAGATAPALMQGRSFAGALEGKPFPDWRTATYYRYWMHLMHHDNPAHFGIRTKDYKLIFYYGLPVSMDEIGRPSMPWKKDSYLIEQTPAAWELYDLRHDPFENRNVYGDPAYREIATKLKRQLRETRQELNESDRNYPHIQRLIEEHWND